ncbi:MAG: hypothetical protein JWR63_139 [Conexibacter sp.]|nr:hypothetical protein [Conexibacter sp.]
MLASDLRYWLSPGSDFSGDHDKTSLLALLPAIFDAQAGPTKLTYREITRVSANVSAKAGDLLFSVAEPRTTEGPAEQGLPGWARRVSNLRPLACEEGAGVCVLLRYVVQASL